MARVAPVRATRVIMVESRYPVGGTGCLLRSGRSAQVPPLNSEAWYTSASAENVEFVRLPFAS
jgi:hypothetical protein